jgi:hypothetical protein
MNKFIFSILLGCAVLAAQPGINNRAVRDIRLQNLKRDYTGSTIRFIVPGSTSVMGVLKDVYSHEEINYIFIDPGFTGKLMAFGVGLLGGAAGYMGVIIAKENANPSWKGVVSSLGLALGGRIGFKTFYKPIKIDISGKTRE